jgi:hypothetical protein
MESTSFLVPCRSPRRDSVDDSRYSRRRDLKRLTSNNETDAKRRIGRLRSPGASRGLVREHPTIAAAAKIAVSAARGRRFVLPSTTGWRHGHPHRTHRLGRVSPNGTLWRVTDRVMTQCRQSQPSKPWRPVHGFRCERRRSQYMHSSSDHSHRYRCSASARDQCLRTVSHRSAVRCTDRSGSTVQIR